MPKIMLHDAEAREALGRGVAKLTKAVSGTLGPRGMNAVMDRPIGTPLVSRDGVSIASEIELECPFENMGAQVLREVSKQTNEVAGDGTTTATVLANFLVQNGLALLAEGANPVELVEGLELAVDETIEALKRSARSLDGVKGLRAIASIAANDAKLGEIVAEAFERARNHGIVAVEFGATVETMLEVIEGMAFERGYLSHHMVTDVERMQVVLDNPCILMTDQKIQSIDELTGVFSLIEKSRRPLLIIAEEVAPPVIMMLLSRRESDNFKVAASHPPENGHWRKAMLDDIALTTGGKVISKDSRQGKLSRHSCGSLGRARHRRGVVAQIVPAPQTRQPLPEIVQIDENHRGRVQRQRLTDDQPADDRDPERVARLRAFAGSERQRQGAEQRGEGRHHDRTKAEKTRLFDRLARTTAPALRSERKIDHHDSVLLHDADEQQDADGGDDRELGIEQPQRQRRADAGREQRRENGERMDQALVEDAEHDIDRDERCAEQKRHARLRLLEGRGGGGEGAPDGGGGAQ